MATTEEDRAAAQPSSGVRSAREELASPATQILRDREDYLGRGLSDVGRRIADDQVELFVHGDPAVALQQQLQRLAPVYMVLHDVGTSASLRLLGALAGAAGARVQRLSIRLQGTSLPLIGAVPVQAIQALPYVLTVVLLAGFIGMSRAPAALGRPYLKER